MRTLYRWLVDIHNAIRKKKLMLCNASSRTEAIIKYIMGTG